MNFIVPFSRVGDCISRAGRSGNMASEFGSEGDLVAFWGGAWLLHNGPDTMVSARCRTTFRPNVVSKEWEQCW